ncbi:MAG: TIGR04282 family arsenosugar biosynthesis glycosyltransferase [Desulfuromonadaceae bacterium]|nr:TIGR04282 family arsenosugar biosynthesis glycosyltransferase [Desulfuromonadaceae bacterium]MDD2848438.1 TIGR04282 family arsenosugar biosynthesis glycosyltransferase [Desulfuromonadaceae bacterium]MDD4129933.1 TIGR04282 family arsenosugar biosynthesis glycosyltransferase [Desulfuromonadaceae bacterium]
MKKKLIVFAREPLPGDVKTRLAASIGDRLATDIYEKMLQDVLETCRQLSGVETVVFWACAENSLPLLSMRYRCRSRIQGAGDLGQRMQAAFEEMFAEGCDLCCIIGSDAPDLPLSHFLEAYRLLAEPQTDVVFGPSKDGGYYLLGLRQSHPQLFTNIPWGGAAVLEQSLAAARDSALATVLLPEWQDIDTVEDLQAFQERKRLSAAMERL